MTYIDNALFPNDTGVRDLARQIVVMGVSGSGKTAIGQALASILKISFVDGDDLHPLANRVKMASGIPLTDEDRWVWLEVVGETLSNSAPVVVACSALTKIYRDRIRTEAPDVQFILLQVPREELEKRMASRAGHFMPPSLLQSQLDLLEPLQKDEVGYVIANIGTIDEEARLAASYLRS